MADRTNYRVPVSCVPSVARLDRTGSSPHDRTIAAFPDIVCALPSVTDREKESAIGRRSSAKALPRREIFSSILAQFPPDNFAA